MSPTVKDELEIERLQVLERQLGKEIQELDDAKNACDKAQEIIETLVKLKEDQADCQNVSIGKQNFYKMKISAYLQRNLELDQLSIIKNFSPKKRIFCATQYYQGISELIYQRFGEPGIGVTDE